MDMSLTAKISKTNLLFELNKQDDLLFRISSSETIKVSAMLCFPWITKTEFISIRDENDKEVYLISTLSELDEISFHAVTLSLLAATFMMKIIEIKAINTEFEIRNWSVVTEQGEYIFQTIIDYWPQRLNSFSVLIRDVSGNIFYIDNPKQLDQKSQDLLWPYID